MFLRLASLFGTALVLAGVLSACGGGGSESSHEPPTEASQATTDAAGNSEPVDFVPGSEVTEGPFTNAFYTPPDPLEPGAPGEIIWAIEVGAPPGGIAWRILYHSTAVDGSDIAVSGVVVAPAEPSESGTRPTVSWAHGTTGLGDRCMPSQVAPANAIPDLADFIEAGYVVVATDYEGLGTPGVHPYIVGESEGRGVLDAVRAAAHLPSGSGGPVVIAGHSQGGHSALFAGEIAPEYAPELDLVGVVALAPLTQVSTAATALQNLPGLLGTLVMFGLGWDAAYEPDLFLDFLTPEAEALLPVAETGCGGDISDAFANLAPEAAFESLPMDNPEFADRASRNSPGSVAITVPVMVVHGTADATIPAAFTQTYAAAACALGMDLQLVWVPGGDHGSFPPATGEQVLAWIADRISGAPTTSNCAALPPL